MDKATFDAEFKATRLARWESENAEATAAKKRLDVAMEAAQKAEAKR